MLGKGARRPDLGPRSPRRFALSVGPELTWMSAFTQFSVWCKPSATLWHLVQPRKGLRSRTRSIKSRTYQRTRQGRFLTIFFFYHIPQTNLWPQMLETNMISPRERPKFLNSLCKMCSLKRTLPKSMVITCLRKVSTIAEYGGGFADVYRGEYDGRTVAVKVARLYATSDLELRFSVGG